MAKEKSIGRKLHDGVAVITFSDEQGYVRAFQVQGHAGFADVGQDIVCAAISALTVSAVNGLERYLSAPPIYSENDGYLACTLPEGLPNEEMRIAEAILGTMLLGLHEIGQSYGSKYITFEQRRWTPC